MLTTQELRRRRSRHARQRGLSPKAIRDFLQCVEVQELLLSRRLRNQPTGKTRPKPESTTYQPALTTGLTPARPFSVAASSPIEVPDIAEKYEAYGAFFG